MSGFESILFVAFDGYIHLKLHEYRYTMDMEVKSIQTKLVLCVLFAHLLSLN